MDIHNLQSFFIAESECTLRLIYLTNSAKLGCSSTTRRKTDPHTMFLPSMRKVAHWPIIPDGKVVFSENGLNN